MKKKSRERLWNFDPRKQKQTFIKDFSSQGYVKAVEESSDKNTSITVPNAKRNGKRKRKKKKT